MYVSVELEYPFTGVEEYLINDEYWSFRWLSVKARTEPNQTEPAEMTEPAQPNLGN